MIEDLDFILPTQPVEKEKLISVNITIPYLDILYERVNPYLTDELLSICMSIIVNRHTPQNQGTRTMIEYIGDTDSYEEAYVTEFVARAIELEQSSECGCVEEFSIISQEEYGYYSSVVRDTLAHFEKYFIENPNENNRYQLEFLSGYFEDNRFIDVKRHCYDAVSGRLFMFLSM